MASISFLFPPFLLLPACICVALEERLRIKESGADGGDLLRGRTRLLRLIFARHNSDLILVIVAS